MVWNDMQWYSYSLPFLLADANLLMDTHWMDTYWWDTCWTDMYWWDMYWWDTFAIPADAHLLNGYALNGYASHGYVLVGYVLKEKVLVRYVLVGYVLNGYVCKTDANLLNGYALNGYVLVGYVLNGYVLVGYVLVGYVLNGYVWDMCDVLGVCGICVVWDTPTIFWRTLRRNVFREKTNVFFLNVFLGGVTSVWFLSLSSESLNVMLTLPHGEQQTPSSASSTLYQLWNIYRDLPRGAEWMIRGACTPSLRVQTAPFGRCPKFKIFPEKWCLEDDPFLLGRGYFSGANC